MSCSGLWLLQNLETSYTPGLPLWFPYMLSAVKHRMAYRQGPDLVYSGDNSRSHVTVSHNHRLMTDSHQVWVAPPWGA